MASRYTLGIGERLKREKDIEALFRKGKALSVFPVRILWHFVPLETDISPIKTGFSAPKKRFKHATDRNRVKRLLKEAWRLQKGPLVSIVPEGQQLHLFLLYVDATLPNFDFVKMTIEKVVDELCTKIEKTRPDA